MALTSAMANSRLERNIALLTGMGVSRTAAKSALRACKGDVEEATTVVFDDKHLSAMDIPSDSEELQPKQRIGTFNRSDTNIRMSSKSMGKRPAKMPVSIKDP